MENTTSIFFKNLAKGFKQKISYLRVNEKVQNAF